MNWLFADWQDNKSHIFSGIRRGLEALGHTTTSITRSDMGRRKDLLRAIRSGEFDTLLTWQRFYRMQGDLLEAIVESGIRTVFTDYGFFPHYDTVVFDTDGESATSSWLSSWNEQGTQDISIEDLEKADRLIQSQTAHGRVLDCPPIRKSDLIELPFIFVPLQRPRDAVVRYDSTVHEFGELLRRVLYLARGRFFVICKTHPHDRNLDLGVPDAIPSSHLVVRESFGSKNEEICDYLLSHASLVVGVNSNMLLRAASFGTPVIATGRGWHTGSGVFHEVDGMDGLQSLSAPRVRYSDQRVFFAKCLTRQLRFDELSDPVKLSRILGRLGVCRESAAIDNAR